MKKVSLISILIIIIILCSSCSNSLLSKLINPDEQKTPEYAIKQYLNLDDSEYKFMVLNNFLFVYSKEGQSVGYKTDKGNYDLNPLASNQEITLTNSEEYFLSVVDIRRYMNKYEIDLSLGLKNKAIENNYSYTVHDNSGTDFYNLQYQNQYIWWFKVLDSIQDDFKLFVNVNGTDYEILNGQEIKEKFQMLGNNT